MSELKAEQFYKDVKDFMDLEKDGFTKLTPTGISPNYESIFDFAEAYYEERKANEASTSENKALDIDLVSGIFMVEDRGKPLSFHQTKEGAEKAVKDWEESTISGEWNIVPIKTLP